MDELKALLKSGVGRELFMHLDKIRQRQYSMVADQSRAGDLGSIRYAAGRLEGVDVVIGNLVELRDGPKRKEKS